MEYHATVKKDEEELYVLLQSNLKDIELKKKNAKGRTVYSILSDA